MLEAVYTPQLLGVAPRLFTFFQNYCSTYIGIDIWRLLSSMIDDTIPSQTSDYSESHDATDQELVACVLAGDKESFRYIIERYQRRIHAYIATTIGYHQQDVEDIASGTFIKVYTKLALYNPRLNLSSWIYRIAHNEAINYIKKNKRHIILGLEEFHALSAATLDFDKPTKADIEAVLRLLNQSDRDILIWFYLEELSIREIAEILKTSENSIKSRLSQARKKAKKLADTYIKSHTHDSNTQV